MPIPIEKVIEISVMNKEETIKNAEGESTSTMEKLPMSMRGNSSKIAASMQVFNCLRSKSTTRSAKDLPNNKTGDSKVFIIQVFVAWMLICIPGNIFAGIIFYQHYHHADSYQISGSVADHATDHQPNISNTSSNFSPSGTSTTQVNKNITEIADKKWMCMQY